MADITISDLELAPALADDMVLPVENTTDTYAATLAMLRRLINKTFVEVENADLNTLTDDGFYQCTGTPTNSPVAGAINWTLQVSAENGVVVQRAFSLDDNFANMYIRRLNGVTWTGWLEVGAGALDNKANVSLSNLSAAGQAKFDTKADVNLSNLNNTGNAAALNLNSKGIRTVTETYVNGTEWYRVWSDGWIEQGGYISSAPSGTTGAAVTFLKPFSYTNYFSSPSWGAAQYAAFGIRDRTTTRMTVVNRSNEATFCYWQACGY